MKNLLEGAAVAFSMYSRLPVPHFEWNGDNMKYSMCFFPLIGIVICAVQYGIFALSGLLSLDGTLRAAFLTAVPVLVTGGIHADGMMDTADAYFSWGDREKKLAILSDSHVGAFAVLTAILYYLIYFGVMSGVEKKHFPLIGVCLVLSRALSALALVTFPKAKKSGLLSAFSENAGKKPVVVCSLLYVAAGLLTAFCVSAGKALMIAISGGAVFLWYYLMCRKHFGGTTGDVAGMFLQMFEVVVLFVTIV